MISFLMVGSLILGLISWILPAINLEKYKNNKDSNWETLSILSMIACAISIYFQIYYSYYLVRVGDDIALIDTIGISTLLSGVLLIVTIILNLITLITYGKKIKKVITEFY